jgi:hypothetical protein
MEYAPREKFFLYCADEIDTARNWIRKGGPEEYACDSLRVRAPSFLPPSLIDIIGNNTRRRRRRRRNRPKSGKKQ